MAILFKTLLFTTLAFGRLSDPGETPGQRQPQNYTGPSLVRGSGLSVQNGRIFFNKDAFSAKLRKLKEDADKDKVQQDEFGGRFWRGSTCDQNQLKDEVVQYIHGACGFSDLTAVCRNSMTAATVVNRTVQANLKTAQGKGLSSLKNAWDEMKTSFKNVVTANDNCAAAVKESIVNNPICRNTINEFFFVRAYDAYLSQCDGSDFEEILSSVGEAIEDVGNQVQSQVIEPYKQSRLTEHAIAKGMIQYETAVAELHPNTPPPGQTDKAVQEANLRAPADRE